MTHLQFAAADPEHSVWVGASAGTGKTKVLTDRVLRLLLSDVQPEKILCLTFTNAAAAEMANRINEQLGKWTIMPEDVLVSRLTELTATPPDSEKTRQARRLFAEVLDTPEGLKIQTIHSFCQSLMRQFSLEAGIAPHFTLIDEDTAAELLAEARLKLLTIASAAEDVRGKKLQESVSVIACQLHESSLSNLLKELTNARAKLESIITLHGGMDGLIAALYQELGVEQHEDEQGLKQAVCQSGAFDHKGLKECCAALLAGSVKEQPRGEMMAAWLAATPEERIIRLNEYIQLFLTKADLEPRAALANKPTFKKYPAIEEILQTEQRRIQHFVEKRKALRTASLTRHLLCLAEALLVEYHTLKSAHAFLDFNDLILNSVRLLNTPKVSEWILYKMGGGIDHILVDEAQDTSPEQWQIIDNICANFFQDNEQLHVGRTIFVVGDEKQSIFSFQGADPLNFNKMHTLFRQKTELASKSFRSISLDRSFRSTSAVLQVVDKVFEPEPLRAAVCSSDEIIRHDAHRKGHAGRVELWPPISPPPKEEDDEAWEPPLKHRMEYNTQKILAELIAHTIGCWLEEKRLLPSQDRPIKAGDILILVRRRKEFSHYLVTALKKRQIPVAGADRMVITDNLAVMDMMALCRFLLLPQDDLTLATVLKTPLFGISEEDLFTLAYDRGKLSLWNRLKTMQAQNPLYQTAYDKLAALLIQADKLSPFELCSLVLEVEGGRRKFTGRMGEEMSDALDEFLSLALNYEQTHIPSLQGFIHWLETGSTEVKRDMEQGKDQVRIMTVHGSKGLQAPIVFLPDTTQTPSNRSSLLWNDELVLWPGGAANNTSLAQMIKERNKQKELEEYQRLLYVGLTRAEDEMIICGWQGKKAMPEECWYNVVKSALLALEETKKLPFEIPEDLGYTLPETIAPITLSLCHTQEIAPVPRKTTQNIMQQEVMLPSFLLKPLPTEQLPASPLMPSLLVEEEEPSRSPLQRQDNRFQRGLLIHKLLQFLPDIAPDQRQYTIDTLLARYGRDFHPAAKGEIKKQVLTLLRHPAFSPVFGTNSQAEVPISGTVTLSGKQQRISGQIDRLLVNDTHVLVIDYKTNQHPPETLETVPPAYIAQMRAYHALLQQLYPDKQIECALLWTQIPLLMPVSNSSVWLCS